MEQRKNAGNPQRGHKKGAAGLFGQEVDGLVVDKNFEEGKFEVGYMRSDGKVGSKFQMYHNLDALAAPSQAKTSNYSLKKTLFPMAE